MSIKHTPKHLSKRLLSMLLCLTLIFSIASPLLANAEDDPGDPVSQEKLEEIIAPIIDSLIDADSLKPALTNIITPLAQGMLGSSGDILGLVQPAITTAVTQMLLQYIPNLTQQQLGDIEALVGQVLGASFFTDAIQYLLDNGFVERTIDYALDGALGDLDTIRDDMRLNAVNEIFNTLNTQSYGGVTIKLPETIPMADELFNQKILGISINDIIANTGMLEGTYYKFPTKTYLFIATPKAVHGGMKAIMNVLNMSQNDGLFSFYDLTCTWNTNGTVKATTINGWNAKFITAYLSLDMLKQGMTGMDFTGIVTEAAGKAALDILKETVFGLLNDFFDKNLDIQLGLDPKTDDWDDILPGIDHGALVKVFKELNGFYAGLGVILGLDANVNDWDDILPAVRSGSLQGLCQKLDTLLKTYDPQFDALAAIIGNPSAHDLDDVLAALEGWFNSPRVQQLLKDKADEIVDDILGLIDDWAKQLEKDVFKCVTKALDVDLGDTPDWDALGAALEAKALACINDALEDLGLSPAQIAAYKASLQTFLGEAYAKMLAFYHNEAKPFVEEQLAKINAMFKLRLRQNGVKYDFLLPGKGPYTVVSESFNVYRTDCVLDIRASFPAGQAEIGHSLTFTGEKFKHHDFKTGSWILNVTSLPTEPGEYFITLTSYALLCDCEIKLAERTFKFIVAPAEYWTVTFDAAGGAPVPAVQNVVRGEKAIEPAAPARSGYSFNGWFLNGAPWDFNIAPESDITLTAQWTRNSPQPTPNPPSPTEYWTVVFDAAGGAPAPDQQSVVRGSAAARPADPVLEGFTFDGWYNGDTLWDFSAAPTGNVTLVARWTAVLPQDELPTTGEPGGTDTGTPTDTTDPQDTIPTEPLPQENLPFTGGTPLTLIMALCGLGMLAAAGVLLKKKKV